MRTKSIRTIRRSELSRAAFEAVVQFGLRGTTLERVGKIAGVSKGVVLHHFKDKSALLEAVFRRSNAILGTSLVELLRHATTPHERLWAIVYANFGGAIYNKQVCHAWVSLIAEVPHNAMCQRVQAACNARITSNFRHELKHFLDQDEARRFAHSLGLLIDGIWVRSGLAIAEPDSKGAVDEFEFAIVKILACSPAQVAVHKAARQKIEGIASLVLTSRAFQGH
jgi:TetR/AcrR family transcriptional regulator, transcriptional repressor of bet genes